MKVTPQFARDPQTKRRKTSGVSEKPLLSRQAAT
jgi:hypothetical protein